MRKDPSGIPSKQDGNRREGSGEVGKWELLEKGPLAWGGEGGLSARGREG